MSLARASAVPLLALVVSLVAVPSSARAGQATVDCGGAFDHEHLAWDRLLAVHVREGLVDYRKWQHQGQAPLDGYLRQLEAVCGQDQARWSRHQRLAFWINAYNAYTVRLILDHYPLESIRSIGLLPMAAFRRAFINLPASGRDRMSLNDIEHQFLRGQLRESRIHFAIVCASKGCPALQPWAYRASGMEGQLQAAAHQFLGDPRKNRFDPASGTLQLSAIFKWFRQDFEQASGTLAQYVSRHAPASMAAALASAPTPPSISFLPYDWSLNAQR